MVCFICHKVITKALVYKFNNNNMDIIVVKDAKSFHENRRNKMICTNLKCKEIADIHTINYINGIEF